MKVLEKGIMPDGTKIQIEDWSEDYSSSNYASTLGTYPKSKANHKGEFAPKLNETYRIEFDFKSAEEAKNNFKDLIEGKKNLKDFSKNLYYPKFADCI